MFKNTLETKKIAATNALVGCGTSERTMSIDVSGKKISSDVGKEVVDKKV